MAISERATGRSFRTLLQAMLKASEGNHVIVAVTDYQQLRRSVDMLHRMLDEGGVHNYLYNSYAPQIKFTHAPDSSITVVQYEDVDIRIERHKAFYKTEPHVFTDHWVMDKRLIDLEKRIKLDI
ncbi:hypothetical protein NVP3058O_049 [Vibrio phage 3.058.O._10N.286.46.B8]|nr:hypothetical protein NVP2058O_050 [Vibrio phage 2.058.O._10N.286.46.B8]AUS03119.1 hypothetical protein NVP3058O_049 [Vibrio phage 3.058.O._10N.286.46.B8]